MWRPAVSQEFHPRQRRPGPSWKPAGSARGAKENRRHAMMRHRHHPRPTPPPPPTPPPTPPPPPPPAGGYLFRDEFTGPAGATPAAGTSPSSRLWNVRNIGPAGIYGTADSYYTDSTSAVCLA